MKIKLSSSVYFCGIPLVTLIISGMLLINTAWANTWANTWSHTLLNDTHHPVHESDIAGYTAQEWGFRQVFLPQATDLIRPDETLSGSSVPGLKLTFLRKRDDQLEPVSMLKVRFSDGVKPQGLTLTSNLQGVIEHSQCQRSGEFTLNFALESDRYSITTGGKSYFVQVKARCGKEATYIFNEDTPSGQAVGIWQILTLAERKLGENVSLSFWKFPVEVVFPGRGDYYSDNTINITQGHHWDVVAHELGHAIYDQARIGVFGGGEHYIDRCHSDSLAISEGWASFFAAWVNFSVDHADPAFPYMVQRRAPIAIEHVPHDVCWEPQSEWRAFSFLWDLIDTHLDQREELLTPQTIHDATQAQFAKLWSDTLLLRARSVPDLASRLISKGWNKKDMELTWLLNFSGPLKK